MSTLNSYVRAVHALATLRHTDTPPHTLGVIFEPARPGDASPEAVGPTATSGGASFEVGEARHWEAKVRLGGGKWGDVVGVGSTPEAALLSLFRGYAASHRAVDGRRAEVLARLSALEEATPVGAVLKASLEEESQRRFVTCDAGTGEPNGYATVDVQGEVTVGGRPLSLVEDVNILRWAAQAVPTFLATGKRAPVPG